MFSAPKRFRDKLMYFDFKIRLFREPVPHYMTPLEIVEMSVQLSQREMAPVIILHLLKTRIHNCKRTWNLQLLEKQISLSIVYHLWAVLERVWIHCSLNDLAKRV